MSDAPSQSGPLLGDTITEVQGVFPSDAALQDALARLTLAGFDRADFSLPETMPQPGHATPDQGAEPPNTDIDNSQLRNMSAGMAGTIGGFAAAAVTAATGGTAAIAIGAAAAVGAGAGVLTHAAGAGVEDAQHQERERRAREGTLILAVNAPDAERGRKAEAEMRAAGATRVESVQKVNEEIVATGWTG